jgi:DNA-damage-inducible protein J
MPRTAMIRARTAPELKEKAEHIFEQLGLTSTDAINLFYAQVALHNGMPFAVKIPNKTTVATFEKTDRGEELTEYGRIEDMLSALGLQK